MCDTNPMQNHYLTMGFAGEGLWGMGYDGLMGYGTQIPAYQLGGLTFLWGIGGYGLSTLWLKRGSTVVHHHRHTTTPPCLLCYHLTLTLLLGVFVLSGSLITLSSRHSSRATLTCRLGCLGGSVRCPSLLSSVLDLQVLSNFPHDTLHEQHWRAAWLPR